MLHVSQRCQGETYTLEIGGNYTLSPHRHPSNYAGSSFYLNGVKITSRIPKDTLSIYGQSVRMFAQLQYRLPLHTMYCVLSN